MHDCDGDRKNAKKHGDEEFGGDCFSMGGKNRDLRTFQFKSESSLWRRSLIGEDGPRRKVQN